MTLAEAVLEAVSAGAHPLTDISSIKVKPSIVPLAEPIVTIRLNRKNGSKPITELTARRAARYWGALIRAKHEGQFLITVFVPERHNPYEFPYIFE